MWSDADVDDPQLELRLRNLPARFAVEFLATNVRGADVEPDGANRVESVRLPSSTAPTLLGPPLAGLAIDSPAPRK